MYMRPVPLTWIGRHISFISAYQWSFKTLFLREVKVTLTVKCDSIIMLLNR